MAIELSTFNNPILVEELEESIGQPVIFSNGCTLDLCPVIGFYWGSTPCGIAWVVADDHGWVSKALEWLESWEPAWCVKNENTHDKADHYLR